VRLSDDPRDRGGLDLLRSARARGVGTPVIMVTCATELAEIREAMRSGAQDYILKDELCPEMLLPVIDVWRERRALRAEVTELREKVERTWGVAAIAGSSPAMDRLRKLVKRVAESDATVLIRGDTGTGKELVARAIHQEGSRRNEPFIAINCSALPGTLIESLLFGHERGAFTGAERRTRGQFELARGGTLFLDEVGTMPLAAQVRLLRVLQEREVQPLGGGPAVRVDVRVVTATNSNLWKRVQDGAFREDLYYRLDVVPIELPPLRARRDEIPFLAQHFLNRKAREHGLYPKALHPSVDPLLMALPWPGNVRQLENAIERAIVLSATRPVLTREDFGFLSNRPEDGETNWETKTFDDAPILQPVYAASPTDLPPDGLDLNQVVSDMEKKLMLQSLAITRGNKKRAAELLGLKRTTFLEKMKRLDLQDEGDGGEAEE